MFGGMNEASQFVVREHTAFTTNIGQRSRPMIFKRVNVPVSFAFGAMLPLRQHRFGGDRVITQRHGTNFSSRIGTAPPKGFRLHTDTPRPGVTLVPRFP